MMAVGVGLHVDTTVHFPVQLLPTWMLKCS